MIRSGVITVTRRNIPIERVQNIEIEQGLIQRLTRTARVRIFTAGSQAAEGMLDVVSLAEAHRVRETVRQFKAAAEGIAPPGVEPALEGATLALTMPDEQTARADHEGDLVYTMDLKRVILSGAFRFSLLYVALFFSGLQYIEPDPSRMVDWMEGRRLEGLAQAAQASPWIAAVGVVFIAALFGWLSGILVNLNRYYGFTLNAEGSKLHTKQGLLSRHTGTIPQRKVQAFIIRTNPLMRRFGWYRLEVQTMGFDVKERGHKVAVPFGRMEEVIGAANRIQAGLASPDPLGVRPPTQFQAVSKLTIRRAFIRYAVAISIVAGAIWYFWTPGAYLLTLLPLALLAAVLRYRHLGWDEDDRWLYVRRGVLRQYTWLLPLERTQVVYRTASVFQRRLGLASLYLDMAGASPMRAAEVVDLPEDVAGAVMERSYQRFQALSQA